MRHVTPEILVLNLRPFLFVLVSVLLSEQLERFSVSRTRDSFLVIKDLQGLTKNVH